MRRTSSVSLIGTGNFMISDCSPLAEPRKEKHKSSSPAAVPPRQVIGFHPKSFIQEEDPHQNPALHVSAPTSPRPPQQVKSPGSGSTTGSPRSVLGDLFVGSRPWEKRDEGVGLGIVAALGGAPIPEEDFALNKYPSSPLAPTSYTRKMSPVHLPSVFAPTTIGSGNKHISPPIPIVSPRSLSPASQNCAPQFGLSTAMQETMMPQDLGSHHRVGRTSARASNTNAGTLTMLSTWSQHADHMEVAAMSMTPSLVVPKAAAPSYLPALSSGLTFLDACFYCKRRLGEGRDIYMYRGDRAFCSPECRHQQIVMDERPEKCGQTAMKVRGGADTARHHHGNQRSGVAAAAGTAAAA
ncbi:hypothetical protein R1sor_003387 [Riccia sorocarpa]|uniref:FLZ-type domain-containing protein n=1 Tax=Riccia sorocarpa TaxID=122646 RepID=A0ABD3H1G6_9MARC